MWLFSQGDNFFVLTELKDNKFLNLTLDFYSGAMMAIDSAKVLGLPVHIKILDVESSRSSSNVAQLIAKNDFSKVDAVIGPFMHFLCSLCVCVLCLCVIFVWNIFVYIHLSWKIKILKNFLKHKHN